MPRPIPGKLNYGAAGPVNLTNLAGELYKLKAGLDFVAVHFKSGAEFADLRRRRSVPAHHRQRHRRARADGGRQAAPAGGDQRAPAKRLPRSADHDRGRRSRLCGDELLRRGGAGRHARAGDRAAQRRHQRRAADGGGAGRAQEARRRAHDREPGAILATSSPPKCASGPRSPPSPASRRIDFCPGPRAHRADQRNNALRALTPRARDRSRRSHRRPRRRARRCAGRDEPARACCGRVPREVSVAISSAARRAWRAAASNARAPSGAPKSIRVSPLPNSSKAARFGASQKCGARAPGRSRRRVGVPAVGRASSSSSGQTIGECS